MSTSEFIFLVLLLALCALLILWGLSAALSYAVKARKEREALENPNPDIQEPDKKNSRKFGLLAVVLGVVVAFKLIVAVVRMDISLLHEHIIPTFAAIIVIALSALLPLAVALRCISKRKERALRKYRHPRNEFINRNDIIKSENSELKIPDHI